MAVKRKRLNMRAIWSHSGKIGYDILRESGVYNTMINMGLMGLLLMSYVSMLGCQPSMVPLQVRCFVSLVFLLVVPMSLTRCPYLPVCY